jgi:hypothetical protein
MSKLGIILACRDHESLRLHLASHLRFTNMRDIAFLVVPRVADEDRIRMSAVVEEFRGWAPYEMCSDIRMVPREGLSYLGRCFHLGAEAAVRTRGCDVLLFASESTVVGPGWREVLEEDIANATAIAGGKVGLVGARSNDVEGPQSIFHPALFAAGISRRSWQDAVQDPRAVAAPAGGAPAAAPPASMAFAWPRIVTFFAAIPAESYFAAGGFDTELPADGASDDTLCVRLLRRGYHNFVSRCFVPCLARSQGPAGAAQSGRSRSAEEDLRRGAEWYREHYPDREEIVRRELQWTGFRDAEEVAGRR